MIKIVVFSNLNENIAGLDISGIDISE